MQFTNIWYLASLQMGARRDVKCEYKGNGFKFENGDDSGIWVNAIQVSFCLVPENVFRNKMSQLAQISLLCLFSAFLF